MRINTTGVLVVVVNSLEIKGLSASARKNAGSCSTAVSEISSFPSSKTKNGALPQPPSTTTISQPRPLQALTAPALRDSPCTPFPLMHMSMFHGDHLLLSAPPPLPPPPFSSPPPAASPRIVPWRQLHCSALAADLEGCPR